MSYLVLDRVSAWNALRYDRQLHVPLAISMLTEEYEEWLSADTDVDRLDALCDIVFVALGVIWKCNVDLQTLMREHFIAVETLDVFIDSSSIQPVFFIRAQIDIMATDLDYPLIRSVAFIVLSAIAQMMHMGLTTDQVNEALLIVCDANDTKTVTKLGAADKGFGDGKGAYFAPPEPRLKKLLERRREV